MLSNWKTVAIREVYAGMYDGPHATPKPSESGPIFLGIKNVGENGQLDLSEIRHISEDEYPRWIKRVEPRPGDIVFSYEATLNRYAIIPKGFRGCLGRRMALIRPDESKACGKFLYYYFFSEEWRTTIAQNILIGSTVDRIPIGKFPDFPITVPPLPTQRKIAAILSAYDDLIENNLRRIKILEEMAQNLYREWFVKFRFPGHGKVRFIDSSLGRIPEGWEVRNVKDVATVTYGFPFKSKKFNSDQRGTPVVRIRDIPAGFSTTFTEEDAEPKYHVRTGHILVGMDGDFHMCIWASGHAFQNQRVARFESNGEISNFHLFLALEKPIQEFNKAIVGTTVAHLGDMHIKMIQIVWPPTRLRAQAACLLEPISEQIIALKRQIQNLRRTRDLLLPKLISGKVDVSNLDIAIPEETIA